MDNVVYPFVRAATLQGTCGLDPGQVPQSDIGLKISVIFKHRKEGESNEKISNGFACSVDGIRISRL